MNEVVSNFIERLGICGEEDGMPRIAGRMVGFLMASEGSHSLDDLAEALQISKTSASTNARLLEDKGILMRTASPGDRRDYYAIAEGHWEKFIVDATRRIVRLRDLVQETLRDLPADNVAARRRLYMAARFYDFLIHAMEEDRLRWREIVREVEMEWAQAGEPSGAGRPGN